MNTEPVEMYVDGMPEKLAEVAGLLDHILYNDLMNPMGLGDDGRWQLMELRDVLNDLADRNGMPVYKPGVVEKRA